jgi:DNA-binding transcriptional ArsR family regulator
MNLPSDADSATIRPYVLTGGRVGQSNFDLPLETLVAVAIGKEAVSENPEKQRILALAAQDFISVAELSSHVQLPIGVVRVLVSDLAEEGLVTLYKPQLGGGSAFGSSGYRYRPPSLAVLESVLDGISAL